MTEKNSNKILIKGREIFKLIDSCGMPLYLINELLRENNQFFDIEDFIIAAKSSKNYKDKSRLRSLFIDNMLSHKDNEIIIKLFDKFLDIHYATK